MDISELEKQLARLEEIMTPENIANLSDEELQKLKELIQRIKNLLAD